MSNLNSFDQLFAANGPQVNIEDSTKKELIEWRPSFKNAPNKTYTALIRFVPWWQNPSESILEKFSCYLENPYQPGTGRTIDCPSSIGEKDPIGDTFWSLRNSGNAVNEQNAKKFSRTQKYSMLVQILKDDVNPKLNGSILVWRVGKKVYEKIQNEMRPVMEGIPPRNPFDMINGRAFFVRIVEVSGFNNYDQSQFVDLDKSYSCLKLARKNEDGTYQMYENVSSSSDKQKVFDYLKEYSPDLSKFKYQPWDEETTKYVDSVIAFYTGRAPIGQGVAAPVMPAQKVASLDQVISSISAPSAPVVTTSAVSAPGIPTTAVVPGQPPVQQITPGVMPAGLNLDSNLSTPQAPEAKISGVDMGGLEGILGAPSAPVANPQSPTTAPVNLDDILASTFN